jgi:hypothetical protein
MALSFVTRRPSQRSIDSLRSLFAGSMQKRFPHNKVAVLGVMGAIALTGCRNQTSEPEVTAAPPPVQPSTVATSTPTPSGPTLPYARKVEKQGGGVAGIAAPGTTAPAIKSETPGKPPRMVPVPGVPTPIQPPRGQAGTPGKRATR